MSAIGPDTSKTTRTSTAAPDAVASSVPSASHGSPTTTPSSPTSTLDYVSLFSGVGGLDLGLDRAGWCCLAQVEIDPYRRSVLSRHWPEVPRHDDVRTFPRWWRRIDRPPVHAVVGGFPCQPFSHTGRMLGVADQRWGWPWFIDAVDTVGASVILFENVRGLLRDQQAFAWILADLAERGFDAQWSLVSACAVGAPHMRRRLFLVAHPAASGWAGWGVAESGESAGWQEPAGGGGWEPEPGVGRVAHGVPDRVDRVAALGDAVVPRVAELIGRRVLAARRSATGCAT